MNEQDTGNTICVEPVEISALAFGYEYDPPQEDEVQSDDDQHPQKTLFFTDGGEDILATVC